MPSSYEKEKNIVLKQQSFAITGMVFMLVGFLLIYPVLYGSLIQETGYLFRSTKAKNAVPPARIETAVPSEEELLPKDSLFGIVIPKIGANTAVIANVDPYDESVYQSQLSKGVAHASGTVFPGDIGRMFLFAHSAENAWFASRYNAVFYLLPKLQQGDPVYIYYNNTRYTYTVTGSQIVSDNELEYLEYQGTTGKELVLMTCWPAGTTLQRYLVFATLQ